MTTNKQKQCGDHQSRATDLIDAAMVLRHSIHQTSVRNNGAVSHYDYKMYAIVEQGAVSCSQVLRDLGFELLLRNTPVHDYEIQGEYLKNNVKKAWCCGAKGKESLPACGNEITTTARCLALLSLTYRSCVTLEEFVKLYAYALPEPLVVHLDVDFVMHKPMDTLFDVLLYDKDSVIGRTARAVLEVERKQSAGEVIRLPDRPQAALTRDWGQVIPSLLDRQKPLYQAGFLAARTNPQVVQDVSQIIQTGNYTKLGGWGDLGYGHYLGAMAMQGLMAYYYDQHAAGEWIELNQCRYNHMGMDTKFRGIPNYSDQYKDLYGKCRNNAPYCEDCMVTSTEDIHNIHFTQCRKPWLCIGQGNEDIQHIRPLKRSALQKALIPVGSVHVDHCLQLAKIWHGHRSDLETKLAQLVNDDSVSWGRNGTYMADVFQGHCSELGPSGYLPVGGKVENLKLVHQIYNGD